VSLVRVLMPLAGSAKPPAATAGGKNKILQILGDAPSHIIDKLNAETKPWYLRPSYDEILIDPDGKVRGGTLPALVERLTAHEHTGSTYTRALSTDLF
jgi:son of sevenless